MLQDPAEVCPSESILQGYLLRKLEEAERDQVEEHLCRCPPCRDIVAIWASRSEETNSQPTSGIDGSSPGPMPTRLGAGDALGRFEILGRLGTGAFGTVYEGRDPEIDRRVALKFVPGNPEDASKQVGEAQALGRLNHPNVVTVYEVGRVPGGVIVVMELVVGRTLARWASSTGVTARDIAAMFVQLGRGLAAVHEAGLVHRDIKPHNILIGEDGRARIVDFGLATTATPGVASKIPPGATTMATWAEQSRWGGAGTPAYMAPERLAGEEATQRSDQFSLCVTIFEAVHGIRPFSGATVEELHATMELGRVAVLHGGREAPGWLAHVVRRGLAFDPAHRFASLSMLVDALERGLGRKRRYAVAATASVAAGLAAWAWHAASPGDQSLPCTGAGAHLAGVWDDARRAEVREAMLGVGAPYSEGTWKGTAAALDQYTTEWTGLHTEACEATAVRSEQSWEVLDLRMECLRRAILELDALTNVMANADAQVLQRAHTMVGELPPTSRCADIEVLRSELEPPPPEEATTVEKVRWRLAQANAERLAGHYESARARVGEAKQLSSQIEYRPVRAEVALLEGYLLERLGDYSASETALRDALKLSSESRQWRKMSSAASMLMFVVGYSQQKMEDGLRYRELAEGLANGDARAEAKVRESVAVILDSQGKNEEAQEQAQQAVALCERSFEREHPSIGVARSIFASTLSSGGKYKAAEAEFRRVLETRVRTLGLDHPSVAVSRDQLAATLVMQGRYAEAEVETRRAFVLLRAAYGPEHRGLAISHDNLANILVHQGKYAEAEAEQRLALDLDEKAMGADFPGAASSRHNLALILQAQGRYAESEAEHRRALVRFEKVLGPDHPHVAIARHGLANVLEARDQYDEAEAEHRRALALEEEKLDPEHPSLAAGRNQLASLLLARGETDEALELAEQAWTIHRGDVTPPEDQANSAFLLARALWPQKWKSGPRRAVDLARTAIDAYRRAGDVHKDDQAEVEAWLEARRDAGTGRRGHRQ